MLVLSAKDFLFQVSDDKRTTISMCQQCYVSTLDADRFIAQTFSHNGIIHRKDSNGIPNFRQVVAYIEVGLLWA